MSCERFYAVVSDWKVVIFAIYNRSPIIIAIVISNVAPFNF